MINCSVTAIIIIAKLMSLEFIVDYEFYSIEINYDTSIKLSVQTIYCFHTEELNRQIWQN